ncbi:MAG TPA: hypothetical protein VE463_01720 [Blastococcus sp.]|nr:hypothetical protein [Blastococcus sp.]
MSDPVSSGASRTPLGAVLSPSEKLACEWEARHDVAARGRRVDPAAALCRYLTQSRIDEARRHLDTPTHDPGSSASRRARRPDDFAARHPLTATWLRWGEDPR